MECVTALGFAAGTLTTIAFWPQLRRTWVTRSADDLSLGMLLTFTTGVFLWLLYGIYLNALPIIVANAITFILTVAILVLRIRYRPR
jgi:MtN3 and saliva related transmembrane protein